MSTIKSPSREPKGHTELTSGATWFQKGSVVHHDFCVGPEDCILSIFWPEGFDVEFVNDTCPPGA